jgi:hypothetical protein
VLWCNDIEQGFNRSTFSARGTIDDYRRDRTSTASARGMTSCTSFPRRRGTRPGGAPLAACWEIEATAGARHLLHFRDELERCFTGADHLPGEIAARHPLLEHHAAPHRSRFLLGAMDEPAPLTETVDGVIREASGGWRRLSDVASALRAGRGLVMNAPERICVAVAAALETAGVSASIVGAAPARQPGGRALLGGSYVIARTFAFERR